MQESKRADTAHPHPAPLTHHAPAATASTGVVGGEAFSIPMPQPAYRSAPAHATSSGLSAQAEALSLKALTQRFYSWFKDSGMLAALQTQFRAQMIQQLPRRHLLQAQAAGNAELLGGSEMLLRPSARPKELPLLQRAANTLIAEYLAEFDYPFTLSIFGPESGTRSAASGGGSSAVGMLSTEDVLALLRIGDDGHGGNQVLSKKIKRALAPPSEEDEDEEDASGDKENAQRRRHRQLHAVREGYDSRNSTEARVAKRRTAAAEAAARFPKRSLLAILLDSLASQPAKPLTVDSGAQTEQGPEHDSIRASQSIDTRLKAIDDEYLSAHLAERESLFPTLQEKMLRFEREQNEKFAQELEQAKNRFVETELARVRAEERATHRAEEEKLRRQLRREHEAHLDRIRSDSTEAVTRLANKEREVADTLFRERQQLQTQMNTLHQREVELSRKRDVMDKTQALAESKLREGERLLSVRGAELEHLAANLQAKINEEKKRVRSEWQEQVLKRDEIVEQLSSTLKSVESKLSKKSAELDEALTLMDDYDSRARASAESERKAEQRLEDALHKLSVAQNRVAELETRRSALEKGLLESSAKEQVCFHHLSELQSVRARLAQQADEYEEQVKNLRERHANELANDQSAAQAALHMAHAQATALVSQWKASYVELTEELERRRAEEERAKQMLEEEALVNRELKRELQQLRASGARPYLNPAFATAGAHAPASSPSIPFISSLAASLPPNVAFAALPIGTSMGSMAESMPPARWTPTAAAATSPYTSTSPPVAATITASAPPVSEAVESPAAASFSLDAELFSREQGLEMETQAFTHDLQLHHARAHAGSDAVRREVTKEREVKAATTRHMDLTSAGREFARAHALPPSMASARPSDDSPAGMLSESEAQFRTDAAKREAELARGRATYLEQVARDESDHRARVAAEALQVQHAERQWQADKLAQQRRDNDAAMEAAQADVQRAKQEREQRLRYEEQQAADTAAAQRLAVQQVESAAAQRAADAAAAKAQREVDEKAAAEHLAATKRADDDAAAKRVADEAAASAAAAAATAQSEAAAREAEEKAEAARAQEAREREERRQRMQEEREARKAQRSASPADVPAATLQPSSYASSSSASSSLLDNDPVARQKAEADRAMREHEEEQEAKRARLREQERLERERKEREELEAQLAAQQQQQQSSSSATATAAQSDDAAAVANLGYYDEHGQFVYWTSVGYYDEQGQFVYYTEEQRIWYQQQQQQQSAAVAGYDATTSATGVAPAAATSASSVGPAATEAAYSDSIPEMPEADISAPASDAEHF